MGRPKKENPFHKMLKDGIIKGSWDLVCYAYEMETGEKIEPPVIQARPVVQESSKVIIPGSSPPSPAQRIFGTGENKFSDNVEGNKVSTTLNGKTIDSARVDLSFDRKVKSDYQPEYRDTYQKVQVNCDKCGVPIMVSSYEAEANMSASNFVEENGQKEKLNWLMCLKCQRGG